MTHEAPFSSDAERWREISNFPTYSVSSWGRVRNDESGVIISATRNSHDLPIVGLMSYNQQRGRSVQSKRALPLLVACAFVPEHSNVNFGTPVHLDGDRTNNHYTNIVWRPLWFARRYMVQFTDDHITLDEPVEDVETFEIYKSSMHASTVHGLLDEQLLLSMHNNTYVWPTGQIFRRAL